MNTKNTVTNAPAFKGVPAQASRQENEKQVDAQQEDTDLDSAIEALQAVVMTQKAQIDALLASLEGLLSALNSPASPLGKGWAQPLMAQAMQKSLENQPAPLGSRRDIDTDALPMSPNALLGNPADPQFASLHQLMERLKLG